VLRGVGVGLRARPLWPEQSCRANRRSPLLRGDKGAVWKVGLGTEALGIFVGRPQLAQKAVAKVTDIVDKDAAANIR
jgi:hypothetical protein